MCGICGKVQFKGGHVSFDLIKKMCATIIHRGPDDNGVYVNEGVGLGQTRLSINDLRPEATAPLSNEDCTIWLVFNGEIYNFKELRNNLQANGHEFRTQTDTEVIIHAYEEYGHDCLSYFNGMFAFALWDSNRKELFCARDRVGKKPFCYATDGNSFTFGSEIKAIAVDPDFSTTPDYGALDIYLSYGYVPSPYSAFSGISKLQPGHYLVCQSNGAVNIKRYWTPPFCLDKSKASEHEIKEELEIRIRDAIKLRMISDVPLGAFLSGGIDSTSIVALMAQESTNPIKTFSIGFKDDAHNELPYARMLSDRYQTDHHEFLVEPNCVSDLPHLVRHFNEPFADSSAIPTYYISKMAKSCVTVAISGDGGDELFAGYSRYGEILKWSNLSDRLRLLRPIIRRMEKKLDGFPYNNYFAKVSRGMHMLGNNLSSQYNLQMSVGLKTQEKNELYLSEFREMISKSSVLNPGFCKIQDSDLSPIEYCMLHDQSFYLPDDLMVKSDIASMANSLEVRAPLLDHRLIEYVATIPIEMKWRNGIGKWIFREAFRDFLPSQILNKKKTGFSIPKSRWLRGELNELAHDVLLDRRAAARGILDVKKIARLMREHECGVRDWGNRLWTMLVMEIWFREFIDK